MAKKTVKKNVKKNNSAQTKRVLIIVVGILLGIALILGAILATIAGVKYANSYIYLDGVGVDRGVANYLVTYHKTQYMSRLSKAGVAVSDTPEFWNSAADGGITYGELLREDCRSYVCQLVAANKLFNEGARISDNDSIKIESAISDILKYRAGGSVAAFNDMCAKWGFDYDDFREATEMIFKGWAAKTKLFGSDGKGAADYPEYVEEFYQKYSHVNIVFVRTENTFLLDDEGNRVKDADGKDVLRPLMEDELKARTDAILSLQACVTGMNEGKVDPERFFELQAKHDEGDPALRAGGYYFYPESSYTKEFSTHFDTLTKAACEMKIGESREVSTPIGVAYIYKTEPEAGKYTDDTEGGFFEDFYLQCADSLYQKLITEGADGAVIKPEWDSIDQIALPYNSDIIARF